MNLSLPPPGQKKSNIGSLDFIKQPVLEKENSVFKQTVLRLKIDLVSEGLGKYILHYFGSEWIWE